MRGDHHHKLVSSSYLSIKFGCHTEVYGTFLAGRRWGSDVSNMRPASDFLTLKRKLESHFTCLEVHLQGGPLVTHPRSWRIQQGRASLEARDMRMIHACFKVYDEAI